MLAAANTMLATANSMIAAANAMVAADADSTIAADAAAMLAAANTMLAAADSMLAAAGSILAPEAILRPTGELKPYDLSPIVSADEVRAMPPGTPVFLRTEFANGELADLEMTFVQVVDDFLAPMPVYMVEASDPVLIQLGGIAQGMSGSPIFTEQGTWGAIAYGFSAQDNPPYYFFCHSHRMGHRHAGNDASGQTHGHVGRKRHYPPRDPLAQHGTQWGAFAA
jgi:hypothetical protein